MHQWSLKAVQAFNVWPFPPIDESRTVHENMSPVSQHLIAMLDFHLPVALFLVPRRANHLVLKLDVLAELILVAEVHKVCLNLGRVGIVVFPVWVGLKGISVDVRGPEMSALGFQDAFMSPTRRMRIPSIDLQEVNLRMG